MNESQDGRPTQVTIAAGAVIVGALLLFFSGFDSMVSLHSVDLRERLAEAVGSGSAHGLGITVDDLIRWIHVATLVSGGAAAAAAVLGWFALQRHRGARIALTAIAVVLLVCAPFLGSVLAAFVAAAIAMLWSGQARDWFAGRPVRRREPVSEAAGQATNPATDPGTDRTPGEGAVSWTADEPERAPQAPDPQAPDRQAPASPAPTHGFGDQPTSAPAFGQSGQAPQQPSYPAPQQQPVPYAGWQGWQDAPAPSLADRRPGGVVAACVLTWVFAGTSALVFAFVGAWLAVDPGRLVDRVASMQQFQDAGLSESMIQPVLWVAVAFYVAWSLAACVLAFFAWRRHSWARILLAVSAVGAVVLGAFAIPVSIVHMIACAVAAGLLLGGNSNRWFARRTLMPGPGHQQGPQQGPQQPMNRPPRPW